jgi:hypothetical protein
MNVTVTFHSEPNDKDSLRNLNSRSIIVSDVTDVSTRMTLDVSSITINGGLAVWQEQ